MRTALLRHCDPDACPEPVEGQPGEAISLLSCVTRLSRFTGCRTAALRLPIDFVIRNPRNDVFLFLWVT
jgi:hypothetical protein